MKLYVCKQAKHIYFDTVPVAQSLVILKTGFLFVASEFGNHALYQFLSIKGSDESDLIAVEVEIEGESIVIPHFKPRALKNLLLVDDVDSLSPIIDAIPFVRRKLAAVIIWMEIFIVIRADGTERVVGFIDVISGALTTVGVEAAEPLFQRLRHVAPVIICRALKVNEEEPRLARVRRRVLTAQAF